MAYVAPSTRVTGTLITAAIWNQDVVNNMAHIASLKFADTALSALAAGTAAARISVGSYSGNATDNRWITGVGFTPKWVIIQRGTSSVTYHSNSAMPADTSFGFSAAGVKTDYIQAYNSDGFQIGANADVNASAATFYYTAIG